MKPSLWFVLLFCLSLSGAMFLNFACGDDDDDGTDDDASDDDTGDDDMTDDDSADDDDDTPPENPEHSTCEEAMTDIYNDCEDIRFEGDDGEMSLEETIAACEAEEELFKCVVGCYEQWSHNWPACEELANCIDAQCMGPVEE